MKTNSVKSSQPRRPSQSDSKRLKKTDQEDKQKESLKLWLICGLTVGLTVWGWLLIKVAFTRLHFEISVSSIGLLTPLIGSLLLFCLAYALFGIMTAMAPRGIWGLRLALVLAIVGLITVGFNLYSVIAVMIWGFGLFVMVGRIREEKRERRKVLIHKFMQAGIGLALSALLMAISFCFYAVTIRSGGDQLDPSESLSVITINRLNQYLVTQFPGYDPTITVNEFLFLVAIKSSQSVQVGQSISPTDNPDNQTVKIETVSGFPSWLGVDVNKLNHQIDSIAELQTQENIPADFLNRVKQNPRLLKDSYNNVQTGAVGRQIDQARDEIARQLNIEANGQEAIGTVLSRVIAQKIHDLFGPFIYLIPPLLALGLYFILQIFNFIFIAITLMFARIIFAGLRWIGFYRIIERPTTTEVLTME
jgi:hypothetical protein